MKGFSFTDIINKINLFENFDFARYGDGEWNCLFQDCRRRANCDHHVYFPDMGGELKDRLYKWQYHPENYYIGLQSLAYKQRKEQIDNITTEYNLEWCNSNLLHHASIKGHLWLLFEALKGRDVVIVGPAHFQHFEQVDFHHIEIPDVNCWLEYETIKSWIADLIHPQLVILYAASMMSNVLIDDFAGQCTQIDCGSVFDPYCEINSRKYHNTLKI